MKIYELWKSVSNIPCYCLKISNAFHSTTEEKWIFLTCRVHPGESNSSFIMEGILKQLLSSHEIIAKFTYYIIPILNPDGVYYGQYRWNMIGTDLNRIWNSPSKHFHPTIYFTKELLKQLQNGDFYKEKEELNHSQQDIKETKKILRVNKYGNLFWKEMIIFYFRIVSNPKF